MKYNKIARVVRNPFLILSILLFLSLILIGLILINDVYKTAQSEGYVENLFMQVDTPVGVHMSWKIYNNMPIVGDIIRFRFEPFDANISDNNSLDAYGLSINYSKYPSNDYYENVPIINRTICNLTFMPLYIEYSIPIEGPGKNFIPFQVSYTNLNTGEVITTIPYQNNFFYNSISQEEYNRRQYEKLALIFALISFSLTISISSVKNLMDIWDRKIK